MDLATFNSTYTVSIVAGSVEKPTSVYKKKEAIQVAQSVGQFAKAAPMASLKIMLRTLSKAFSEVTITKQDWQELAAEGQAMMQQQQQPDQGGLADQLRNVPTEIKAQALWMSQRGARPEEILNFVKQHVSTGAQANGPQGATQ